MSFSKDTKRNEYVVRVSYKKPDGTYSQKSKRVKRYADIAKAEHELRLELEVEQPSNVTLEKLCHDYLKWKQEKRRATTVKEKEPKIKYYIIGFFGADKRVSSLDRGQFRQWKEFMKAQKNFRTGKPLSLIYMNATYYCFKEILKFASREYKVREPFQELDDIGGFEKDPNEAPKKQEIRYLTLPQFQMISNDTWKQIENGEPKRQYFLVTYLIMMNVLMMAGLRKGEANALQISDFHNGKTPYLDITKSISQKVNNKAQTGEWHFTAPKTTKSVRQVPIPRYLANLLQSHIDSYLAKLDDEYGPITFLIGGYRPVPDSNFDKYLRAECKKFELPVISAHELRHSYASFLANNGTSLETLSRLLGHASIDETWSTYAHLYPQTTSKAIDAFNLQLEQK